MNEPSLDPDVQALLDEADALPSCAAQNSIWERAAARSEALGDMHTAWDTRCSILSSSSLHNDPKFETLFMNLAWCLAVSDADPTEFNPSPVLWQYKWVASSAPSYASIARGILERIISDMDERFVRAGWGRRAGLMKRMELHQSLGELEQAELVSRQWRSTPRDRGSDCPACEADQYARLLVDRGMDELAIRECRSIIRGTLSCSTVPHSTFGMLLMPLLRLGRHTEAKDLYDRGRRLVFVMESGLCRMATPYILYAAITGRTHEAVSMLRSVIGESAGIRSNQGRLDCFGDLASALACLADRGVDSSSRVCSFAEGH